MTAVLELQPLWEFGAFMIGWGLSILTGLLLVKVAE